MSAPRSKRSSGVLLSEQRGPVLTLSLNRLAQNNTLNQELRQALLGALSQAKSNSEIRAVILTGEGEETFCSGLDLPELAALTPFEVEAVALEVRKIHEALLALDVPTIAVIKGACIGSGLELALHCDIRLARSDARFAFPGVGLGITPGGGSVQRLVQLAGGGAAHSLFLTGSVINAERAFSLGLLMSVIPPGNFAEALREFLDYIVSLPPLAVKEIKVLLRAALAMESAEIVAQGAAALRRCFEDGTISERLRQLYAGPAPGTTLH
ncbi:MAG: enoyl-CoA hydratase/isomerase family protein [Alphaproteobacteria bacterium]|nr:enoyl-CoA hydratase/isomerase family protein [Alphaproteobacteria bacterium]